MVISPKAPTHEPTRAPTIRASRGAPKTRVATTATRSVNKKPTKNDILKIIILVESIYSKILLTKNIHTEYDKKWIKHLLYRFLGGEPGLLNKAKEIVMDDKVNDDMLNKFMPNFIIFLNKNPKKKKTTLPSPVTSPVTSPSKNPNFVKPLPVTSSSKNRNIVIPSPVTSPVTPPATSPVTPPATLPTKSHQQTVLLRKAVDLVRYQNQGR